MSAPDLVELKQCFEHEWHKVLHRPVADNDFVSKRLNDSLVYAFSSPGKRLRPLLVLAAALANDQEYSSGRALKWAMPAAIAVEHIHTYSLIHDDLPAMDNDDFRRGRPSLHRQYDEGLAILAGDALLADAFFWASSTKNNPMAICQELALMAGSRGLVAGQSEDLNRDNLTKDSDCWLLINKAKTARLFEACAAVGALSVGANKKVIAQAHQFGQAFGMAFQLQDDLDDQEGIVKATNTVTIEDLLKKNLVCAKKAAHGFLNRQILLDLLHLTFASWV